jgi:hypothetical protein
MVSARGIIEMCYGLLLTGVLPQAFIIPPRNTGTYVISHCLKTGEFCPRSVTGLRTRRLACDPVQKEQSGSFSWYNDITERQLTCRA